MKANNRHYLVYPFEQYAVHLAGNLQKLIVTTPLFYANGFSAHWSQTWKMRSNSIISTKVYKGLRISRYFKRLRGYFARFRHFYDVFFEHWGSAYPAIAADVMARYGKLREAEVSLCDWHGWTWREDCANSGSLAARGPSWDVMGCLIKINKVFNKDVLSTEYAQLK